MFFISLFGLSLSIFGFGFLAAYYYYGREARSVEISPGFIIRQK